MKKYKIGYTAGVYDMFHVGHLNVLESAKEQCDFLIVAVSTDEVVFANKHKEPIISFEDRVRIVSALKVVDKVVAQKDYSVEGKIKAAKENNIDVMFVGSDWQGTDKWKQIETELSAINCDVVYLPHTDGISSTILREKINKK